MISNKITTNVKDNTKNITFKESQQEKYFDIGKRIIFWGSVLGISYHCYLYKYKKDYQKYP